MRKLRTALTSAGVIGVFALSVAVAPAAQAFPYNGPTWQIPYQPTITVSDRNGYDLNENEAATNWSNDPSGVAYKMAYTQYETCTHCIKVYTGSVGGAGVAVQRWWHWDSYYGRYWTDTCNITVDPSKTGTYWKARQIAVEYGIGRCIGAGDSGEGQSVMNTYNISHPDNIQYYYANLSSGDRASANYYFDWPFPTSP